MVIRDEHVLSYETDTLFHSKRHLLFTYEDLSIEKEKLKVQLSHNAELRSQLNAEKSALQKNLNEMSGDVTMKRVEREVHIKLFHSHNSSSIFCLSV